MRTIAALRFTPMLKFTHSFAEIDRTRARDCRYSISYLRSSTLFEIRAAQRRRLSAALSDFRSGRTTISRCFGFAAGPREKLFRLQRNFCYARENRRAIRVRDETTAAVHRTIARLRQRLPG